MPVRFYAPGCCRQPGDLFDLPRDESAHLARVLRVRTGETISVFDGRGHEATARVEIVDARCARARLLEPVVARPEPPVALTLAQVVLKGDGFDQVVRDATMAGVGAIQPLFSARAQTSALARARHHDRWQRIAVASAKQCGRASLPSIADPTGIETWLDGDRPDICLLLAEPAAPVESNAISRLREGPPPATASLLVGPEGGWTAQEVRLAAARGCVPFTLGRLTFRADAAALVAIAALFTVWEAW